MIEEVPTRRLFDLWLLALGLLVVAYVGLNPPLLSMAGRLVPVAVGLGFCAAFLGWGWLLTRPLGLDHPLDELLVSYALGLGLTALLVFGLGVLGVVNLVIYAVWSAIGLAVAVIAVWRLRRAFSPRSSELANPLSILALVILVPVVLQLVPPLVTPPVSTDALEYHLLIPKIHLQVGRIELIPSLVEASYPCMAEYLYMVVLPLGGAIACKAFHFWSAMALLCALSRLSARVAPSGSRLLGPALYMSMPVAAVIPAWAWNDAIFVLLLLLALGQLLDFDAAPPEDRRIRHLLVAGTLGGLAAWTKYTVVLALLALGPVLLTAVARRRWRWRDLVAAAAPWGGLSLLVFVKNWVFTGNPFYPFLHQLFPSPYWSDHVATYFHDALRRWEIADWSWTTYFTFPFKVAITPRLADTHVGVLPLFLIPALFVRVRSRQLGFLRAFVAWYIVAWLVLHTENRSLLTLFAVLASIGAAGIEASIWQRPLYRRPLVGLVAIATGAGLAMAVVNNYYVLQPIGYFIGKESAAAFLSREAPSQRAFDWLNETEGVGRVLLVGQHAPFYLNREALFSSFADPPIAEVFSRDADSAETLWQRARALGVTHVVVNRDTYAKDNELGLYSWSAEHRRAFEAFVTEHCEVRRRFGADLICEVQAAPDSRDSSGVASTP